MMSTSRFLTFILLVCFSTAAFASEEPEVRNIQFYNAGSQSLSLKELRAIEDTAFKNLDSENISQGFTESHYWLRFSIVKPTNYDGVFYLKTGRPVTDEVDLYQMQNGAWVKSSSGDQMDFSKRDVAHRSTFFKVRLNDEGVNQFYLHLKSDGETLNLGVDLQSFEEFWQVNYKQQTFLGGFYGMLSISAIIYLFFFTSLREKSFLFYGVYVISIALLQGALDGLIYQFIFPSGSYLNARFVLIAALFSNFFLLQYAQHFLKVQKWSPALNKLYRVFYVLIPLVALLLFINDSTLALAYPLSNINGFLSLVLILVSTIFIHLKRKPVDSFFLIGILFLVLSLLVFVMNNLSLLPNSFFVNNAAKFGITLEVVFLSLSMTNLIAQLRRQKEASQQEALERSEDVSAYKTYFMSNISHELRTPINAILGMTTVLLEDSDDPDLIENYRIIKSASFSLLSNVNDILDFEHIEKNDLRLDNSLVFSPREVIMQACESWHLEARKKNLEFIKEMDPTVPAKVRGDEKRFGQIINNLISNAVKFTPAGSVSIKVKSSETSPENCKLEIEIADTGVGMKKEELSNIFESFNQMKLNDKRRFGGLGLGLTIVKHLVSLFKGKIDMKSEESEGTKVELSLDLPVVEKASEDKDLGLEVPEPQNDGNLHVLMVEDNVMNQMILKKLLASTQNLLLEIANNGEEALAMMKEQHFDLILMDLQMPVMDGYEATEAIRSGSLGQAYRQIPIIAVTADAMQETKQRVLKVGMNDYLTKPVRKEVLLERIAFYAKELKIVI